MLRVVKFYESCNEIVSHAFMYIYIYIYIYTCILCFSFSDKEIL